MVYLLSMVSPVVFICNFVCSFADFVVKYLRHVARNFGREVYYILQVIVSSFIIIGVHYAGMHHAGAVLTRTALANLPNRYSELC